MATALPNPFASAPTHQTATEFVLDEARFLYDMLQLCKLPDEDIARINYGDYVPLFISHPSDEYLDAVKEFRQARWNLGGDVDGSARPARVRGDLSGYLSAMRQRRTYQDSFRYG